MKILHVITSLSTGGAEKLMVDLLPRLKEKGHEVDLLLFDGTETPFWRQAEAAGIHVMHTRIGGSVYNPINLIKLMPYLRRYDIVHTHNTAPQLFAAIGSVLCSVVLCTTEHNTSNRRRDWRWYAAIDRWMYNRYKQIICISKKTETHLLDFVCRTKANITTVNNGIDTSVFENAVPSHEFVGEINIISVAAFRYQKDQKTIIRAMQQLSDAYHLYLVGDGELRSDCENMARDLNLTHRVHFLGIRTDVPRLLKESDIVVMSSHWEGFGLAAAEGMAAGKPVIATDVDGLREVVSGAGILFHHEDFIQLADEIKHLTINKDYYQTVAAKCRQRAKEFDISKMVDGYCNVYQNLTGRLSEKVN
jgi:glycosyltransferase involved in cell wall biosynthesis